MLYCENCRSLASSPICEKCGSNKVREVRDEDFCYFLQVGTYFAKSLEALFKNNDIPCASVPFGTGVVSRLAVELEYRKIYVPYKFYEQAIKLYEILIHDDTEELRFALIADSDKLKFENEKLLKKLIKKLKAEDEDQVYDFCLQNIKNADLISDRGKISDKNKKGNYIFINGDKAEILINSFTHEILTVFIKNKYKFK